MDKRRKTNPINSFDKANNAMLVLGEIVKLKDMLGDYYYDESLSSLSEELDKAEEYLYGVTSRFLKSKMNKNGKTRR